MTTNEFFRLHPCTCTCMLSAIIMKFKLYLNAPVPCVTRGEIPSEFQCSIATLLSSTHQKPVLMIINRRKRTSVCKSILLGRKNKPWRTLKIISLLVFLNPHIKVSSTTPIHPSYHHVWLRHLPVGWQSKADPSSGPHTHSETNILCVVVKQPVQSVIFVQSGIELIGGAQVLNRQCRMHCKC